MNSVLTFVCFSALVLSVAICHRPRRHEKRSHPNVAMPVEEDFTLPGAKRNFVPRGPGPVMMPSEDDFALRSAFKRAGSRQPGSSVI